MLMPDFFALLRPVEPQAAMMQEHVQDHVLAHPRREIPVHHADERHRRQQRIADEVIDAGAQRENRLQMRELREKARRRLPGAHIADLGGIAGAVGPDSYFAARRQRQKSRLPFRRIPSGSGHGQQDRRHAARPRGIIYCATTPSAAVSRLNAAANSARV